MAGARAAVRCAGEAQAFAAIAAVTSIVVLALLVQAGNAESDEAPIGLLTLPQVFGEKPCVPFTPRPIPLYVTPSASTPIAHIRVDKDWTFHEDGDCTPVDVRTHHADRPAVALPTRESADGRPAAIVVARNGKWFRIVTAVGPLWIRPSAESRYLPSGRLTRKL
jgi:hypothetical protein